MVELEPTLKALTILDSIDVEIDNVGEARKDINPVDDDDNRGIAEI